MKNNKIMQVAPGDSNSTSAAGAGAEGGVVRVLDDSLSEGDLASVVGGEPIDLCIQLLSGLATSGYSCECWDL
jgi:hypothetical protein